MKAQGNSNPYTDQGKKRMTQSLENGISRKHSVLERRGDSCLGTGVESSTTHPVGDAGRHKFCTVSDGVVGLGHVYLRTQLDKVEERARTWSSSQESISGEMIMMRVRSR